MTEAGRRDRSLLLAGLAHTLPVLWLFRGPIFFGELPFFRDISVYYHPNYVFLARAAAQGVRWPLWNPTSDAGAPFLVAYPFDLLSVWCLGAEGALRLGPPLHVLLSMLGGSWLASRLGAATLGAWAAGLFYGLSGYVLSAVNLFELSHGAAWAPWVVAAFLAVLEKPTSRRGALLALLAAVQISTLAAEAILQTGLLGLALASRRSLGRALPRLVLAGVLAGLLVLPVVLGVQALVEGTRRGSEFTPEESFAWSVAPPALLDVLLPRFFGDPHTFTGRGYWGQPFFTGGFPYLLSLYLGIPVILLAARAGRAPMKLWAVGLVGTLLALGSYGPMEPVLTPLMRSFRAPVKFFLLGTLPLCLLAGLGLDRLRRGAAAPRVWTLAPGLLLLSGALLCRGRSELPGRVFGAVLPELADVRAREVVASAWPEALGATGALALGIGLVLWAMPRRAGLAAVLAGLDLLAVNGGINTSTTGAFYTLRPAMAAVVREAAAQGRYRWFSYGVAQSPGLRWAPEIVQRESDVWLYYLDRQSLLPRTHVFDRLEAAFDEDRVGWSPEGSTLGGAERQPARFGAHFSRLRLANVRWVLSFLPLPEALVTMRRQVPFPEVVPPLRLYELPDPLPRAFGVRRHEVVEKTEIRRRVLAGDFDPREVVLLAEEPPAGLAPTDASGVPQVIYESMDPHTVRLSVSGPAGLVVVLDGYHPGWEARDDSRQVPLQQAYGRYWALATPGGERTLVVRYAPGWVGPSLLTCAAALAATVVAAVLRPKSSIH